MEYRYFELCDFLEDDFFRTWVLKPTDAHELFWQSFLESYPDRQEVIQHAREVLQTIAIDAEQDFPSDYVLENMWEQIQAQKGSRMIRFIRSKWLHVAAAAAIALLVVGWNYRPDHTFAPTAYQQRIESSKTALSERTNSASSPITVTLPDGSTVVLKPKSSLSYPESFNGPTREVYLSGEGFFKVTKNPKQPFLVYANEVVTRVLGTSFTIRAFDQDPDIEVEVKTGRVSVFTVDSEKEFNRLGGEPIIVTPNERILYTRKSEILKKYLVDVPAMLPSDFAAPPIQSFEDAPVQEIFKNLAEAYEIEIVYDKTKFSDCLLTASFSNESLYDKIDLICKGIEAEFTIDNGRVIVSGKGCH